MTTKYPTLTIRIPQYTIDVLNAVAKEYDITKGEIVRQALNLYYKTKYPSKD